MFNDTRATDKENQNYAVLEHIKDGSAVSPKYNSCVINFKIPNIVIVFSNNKPEASHLSNDRWKIFSIRNGGLQRLNTKGGKIEWDLTDHLKEYGDVWRNQYYDRHDEDVKGKSSSKEGEENVKGESSSKEGE